MVWPELPIPLEDIRDLIASSIPTSPVHRVARCRWCGSEFVWVYDRKPLLTDPIIQTPGHWLCRQAECAARQLRWAMPDRRGDQRADDASPWIYVPTPACAEMHESANKNICLGGAAGGSKSHGLRFHAYWWAERIPGYKCLLLRQTLVELENTHLMKMRTVDQHLLHDAMYVTGRNSMEWPSGSVVRAGHCHTTKDVEKALSQEWDEIVIDEASRFDRKVLTGLSSRARSDAIRPEVRERGGGWVRLATNPGGPGARYIEEFYIKRKPDLRKHHAYHPEQFSFIAAKVEDNPYLEEDYVETRLDPLSPERYAQLRHGVWDTFDGQFFGRFSPETHVVSGSYA